MRNNFLIISLLFFTTISSTLFGPPVDLASRLQVSTENKVFEITPAEISKFQERLSKNGDLTPFPELKPSVRKLEQKLQSKEVLEIAKKDPVVEQMRQMALTSLFHIDLEFKVEMHSDAYPVPFEKPFPYRPTIEAISDGLKFLDVLEKTHGLSPALSFKLDLTRPNWFSLLKEVPNSQPHGVSHPIASDQHSNEKTEPERLIIADPVGQYAKYQNRLKSEGENASFPEFKNTVEKLITDLNSETTAEQIKSNPALKYLRDQAEQSLRQIRLEATGRSITTKPYQNAYPYRPTIGAIIDTVKFFDLVERSKFEENPDSQVVEKSWADNSQEKKKIEPLYHFDRYKYHGFGLMSDPNVIIFPTTEALGFQDLIRVRSVPIGFIGVESKTSRVDRHYQTPLDFWYHDVNHVRRMVGYMFGKAKEKGAVTDEQKLAVYKQMNSLIDDLFKLIELPPKPKKPATFKNESEQKNWEYELAKWEKESAKRKLARVLLFEIVHESALPANKEAIIADILRPPDTPQPFEYQSFTPEGMRNIEERRTDNGNLLSGAKSMREFKGDKPTYVHYINDRALGLLANVTNKLQHGFYDSVYDPKNYVVPLAYRTPEHIAEAAEVVLKALGAVPPPREVLVTWADSKKGSPEKFSKYAGFKNQPNGKKAKDCQGEFSIIAAPAIK